MLRSLIVLSMVATVPIAHAEKLLVKGELTFSFYGVAQLRECGTQRQIEFGVMTSTPYFNFLKRHDEVAGAQKRPVLAEVEGELSRTSEGRFVLNSLRVVSIAQGKCKG
ncbi:MAG TPA: hypothetical protein VK629_20185 [Steroidobacteraceae bacterium]|nr:hypothetical protein [Steroidobacteraceae bacterium]